MKTIHKYSIPMQDSCALILPEGARVLTFQYQHGANYIWALVDPDAAPETRRFRLTGTGHEIHEEHLVHIGTIQLSGGDLIFHLFEIIEE